MTSTTTNVVVGVDVGGTGIKAAHVDVDTGVLLEVRARDETPHPGTPEQITSTIKHLIAELPDAVEPVSIGVGFPGVVRNGVIHTAAHLDSSWVGIDAAAFLSSQLGVRVGMVNDADAAGLAEVRFGAGKNVGGVVLMVTLGTGIGTGLFLDGQLLPNTELGHLVIDGTEAEQIAAGATKDAEHESWAQWAEHLDRYLRELERLLWPDLIVLGGGISDSYDDFANLLHCRTPIAPATLGNDAGIIGAALSAGQGSTSSGVNPSYTNR